MLWSPGVSDPLLIDECLSAELPAIAHELGFEAYQVAHFGLAGAPDPSPASGACEARALP